ncbi:mCG140198, partial [Mus musculus]
LFPRVRMCACVCVCSTFYPQEVTGSWYLDPLGWNRSSDQPHTQTVQLLSGDIQKLQGVSVPLCTQRQPLSLIPRTSGNEGTDGEAGQRGLWAGEETPLHVD